MDEQMAKPASGRSVVARWIGQHPGIAPLLVAILAGLLALPALAGLVESHDLQISGRVSLLHAVWLVIALALAIILLASRGSLRRDLAEGTRRLLASGQLAESASPGRGSGPDIPRLGVTMVNGIFDLVLLLIVQGMLRKPFVTILGGYAPAPLVDGGFVAVVVVLALLMLLQLYRASRPLTVYLVSAGLDQLIPTAGFAAPALPAAPTRLVTRPPTTGSRPGQEPTLAAPATVAASEATVPAPSAPGWSTEATVAAPAEQTVQEERPAERPSAEAEATVLEVIAPEPATATLAEAAPTTAEMVPRQPTDERGHSALAEEATVVDEVTRTEPPNPRRPGPTESEVKGDHPRG